MLRDFSEKAKQKIIDKNNGLFIRMCGIENRLKAA